MLVRDLKRLLIFVTPVVFLLLLCLRFYNGTPDLVSQVGGWAEHAIPVGGLQQQHHDELQPQFWDRPLPSEASTVSPQKQPEDAAPPEGPSQGEALIDEAALALAPEEENEGYHTIHSVSRLHGRYFNILFDKDIMNPNIIPHPKLDDTWIVVAQQHRTGVEGLHFVELTCNARFQPDGDLACTEPASTPVPYAPTFSDKCQGALDYFSFAQGPHDARVFYGPRAPFTVYGSNSAITCFGLFMQDFRQLVPDWGVDLSGGQQEDAAFRAGTELQRPPPYAPVEKNWFVFWDREDRLYAHYDFFPRRVFARLASDGSVAGPDLGPAAGDDRCLAHYLPTVPLGAADFESVHQATNALVVTLCRRADAACRASAANTFLFTVVQHKAFYNFHGEYDPYVVVFRQEAPFGVYAVSRRPLWISGRARDPADPARTDMLYVVSVNWKARGQKYHGYLDDVLFVSFGIDDRRAAGIDVLAGDLLAGLGLCSDPEVQGFGPSGL